MRVIAVIHATMLSPGMRGKPLVEIAETPYLTHIIAQVNAIKGVEKTIFLTSSDAADDRVADLADAHDVSVHRGHRMDLLSNLIGALEGESDDSIVLRFSGTNLIYDRDVSSRILCESQSAGVDYAGIEGLSHAAPEAIRVSALRQADSLSVSEHDRQHVTPYIRNSPEKFNLKILPGDYAGLRPELDAQLTIDGQADLDRMERIFDRFNVKKGEYPGLEAIYRVLDLQRTGLPIPSNLQTPESHYAFKVAGRMIGDGYPCFIVAEIGQNHNGQIGMARRLIDMAADCGCDAVKFQKRDVEWELTRDAYNRPYTTENSFGETYGLHREFLELTEQQHRELRDYALSRGLIYFCTACDPPSVEAMDRIGNPLFKIASRDITNIPLLERIRATGKPVVISTGMASMDEIG
ncbi:MAG: N-acetylneuraminate synthase family protein, partial [Planctomycetota bacterium]